MQGPATPMLVDWCSWYTLVSLKKAVGILSCVIHGAMLQIHGVSSGVVVMGYCNTLPVLNSMGKSTVWCDATSRGSGTPHDTCTTPSILMGVSMLFTTAFSTTPIYCRRLCDTNLQWHQCKWGRSDTNLHPFLYWNYLEHCRKHQFTHIRLLVSRVLVSEVKSETGVAKGHIGVRDLGSEKLWHQ